MKLKKSFLLAVIIYFNNFCDEKVFTQIYYQNIWGSKESVSGTGSTVEQTKILRSELSKLIKELNVKSILDIPCGDFNWMRLMDLKNITYIGADIVKPLIEKNQKLFTNHERKFIHVNALIDKLPEVDLIICRDLLVHLSFSDAIKVLKNFKKSKSKYLLTTTFISPQRSNIDITSGLWRAINLQAYPFKLKDPIFILNEKCTEVNCLYADKSLALWIIKDLNI